MYKQELKFAVH